MSIAKVLKYDLNKILEADIWEDFPEVSGKKVFVKPNLVCPPTAWDAASCTHPTVIEAVLVRLKEAGAESIQVGCCGFKGQWERTMLLTGLPAIAERYGAEVICVQEGPNYHEYTLKRLDAYRSLYGTKVSNFVLNADVVINLPKMKVHSMAGITGAIKNTMGVISPKGTMHPGGSAEILQKRLTDLFMLMSDIVDWNLMDGIIGSEYTEQYGVPRKARVLISSKSMFTVDCLAALMMGFSIDEIPYLRLLAEARKVPELPEDFEGIPFERPLSFRRKV